MVSIAAAPPTKRTRARYAARTRLWHAPCICRALSQPARQLLRSGNRAGLFVPHRTQEDKMRKVLYCLAVFVITAGMGSLSAQTQSELSSPDANKADAHDRPIGTIKIKLPAPNGGTNPGESKPPEPTPPVSWTPPSEGEELPPTEINPEPPPPEEPPTVIVETLQGKVVFLIDASGSMYGSRIATVRAEASSAISGLKVDHDVDYVAFGSQFPAAHDYSKFMWGT